MRGGRIYRHLGCHDMDVEVVKISYYSPNKDYFKARVYYIDRIHRWKYYPEPETVKIYKKDLWKWKDVT